MGAFAKSVGQSVSGNPAAETHMGKFRLHSTKASFDVPQAFSIRELSECYIKKLIQTEKLLHLVVAAISFDGFVEFP